MRTMQANGRSPATTPRAAQPATFCQILTAQRKVMKLNRSIRSRSFGVIGTSLHSIAVALVFLLFDSATSAWGQQPCLRWFQVTSAGSPGPRYGHAMAYDSDRGVTVLFGGALTPLFGGLPTDNETWEYDGVAWRVIPITGSKPGARFFHDMVYDSVRREFVLFSGTHNGRDQNDETWTYRSDGSAGTWTRKFTATLPRGYGPDTRIPAPGFYQHKMVFDKARGVTVLFGGTFFRPSNPLHSDYILSNHYVWIWNGTDWQGPFDGSAAWRSGHAVAFDDTRGTVLLFGGYRLHESGNSGLQGGTWEYSNVTWTQVAGSTPALRSGHTMAYDSRRQKIVMFGGTGGDAANADDTDEYTAGVGWSSLLDNGPPRRVYHSMVYDTRRGVMVVNGGLTPSQEGTYADTWELDVCTRPPEVVRWVDFAYTGQEELGTFTAPFNTLAEGATSVPAGGTLKIKAGTSTEKPTISKPMTISAYGGPVIIGQ